MNGTILWANMHLLFWLSLIPFTTGWMGENHFARVPTAAYGVVLLMAALAYFVLELAIIRHQGTEGPLAKALGKDTKGKLSLVLYLVAIAVSLQFAWISQAIYVLVAIIWLVPDQRIEAALTRE